MKLMWQIGLWFLVVCGIVMLIGLAIAANPVAGLVILTLAWGLIVVAFWVGIVWIAYRLITGTLVPDLAQAWEKGKRATDEHKPTWL